LTIRRPNQEIRQILVNVTPIHDPRGAYLGANGLFQDITERRQAEEALRQAQKLESLGVLAGGIAHDFNNLLTAILGNLNLAQTSIPLGSAALPYLENVEKSVLRAADLTKQMLAYSGRGRFVVKVHDLNQVVQEMTTLLRVSIPKKTTLRFHLDPRTLPIEADAAQIHQVVMNLVTNASDAIGEGEGAITLATRAVTLSPNQIPSATPGQMLAPGPYAVMEVSDSGSGMSPEVRARIFDPFFTTKASGRGLGLSAMLGILRAHKAGIQIESQVGEGSTFTLFMPLAAHHHAEPAAAAAASGSRFTGEALVVDDEPTVLEFVSQALELIGFKTTTARDGAEAVEAFTKAPERFDLVLLDLTMPRMDGREALREIRLIRPEVPVILSSGFSDQEFLKETASESNLLFLQKPYQIKELKQIVLSLLRRPLS
jgi:signal transduction histidine kinase/CheY-like chemotaxis protein